MNLFGGKPSLGTCRRACGHREPVQQQASEPRSAPSPCTQGEERGGGSVALQPNNLPSLQSPSLLHRAASSAVNAAIEPLQALGRNLWHDLHTWTAAPHTAQEDTEFLATFARRIPCGLCRNEWKHIVSDSPPPTGSAQMFHWAWQAHNTINAKLKKPVFPLEEAQLLYNVNPAPLTPSPCTQREGRGGGSSFVLANADLTNYFDAIWCINLDTDPDRWQTFQSQLAACDWPFKPVTRFPALHGDSLGVPPHFTQGGGAWGCLQSHRRILELSLMAGHQRILVMEDDADIRIRFGDSARQFLADLGSDSWDCLMLGGQHMAAPMAHKPGVVRAANIQRTHCMAFSKNFMRELYKHWSGPINQHCDWALGPFAAKYKTFAPAIEGVPRFIVGQRGGKSHITGHTKPAEWWNPPPPNAPVVWLRCPRDVIETCRDKFHAGNRRNGEGVCVGLADVFNKEKNPTKPQQIAALKNWISMIQWEVESRGDGAVCTIWCPQADADVVRAAAGNALVEIEVATVEDAASAFQKSLSLVAAISQPIDIESKNMNPRASGPMPINEL